jgi:hypothetical protein
MDTLPYEPLRREDPPQPRRRGRVNAWAIATAVLAATFVLVLISFIEPREWAASVVFISAHIAVDRLIVSAHRRE